MHTKSQAVEDKSWNRKFTFKYKDIYLLYRVFQKIEKILGEI